jgi:hypothetical protein
LDDPNNPIKIYPNFEPVIKVDKKIDCNHQIIQFQKQLLQEGTIYWNVNKQLLEDYHLPLSQK